MAGVHTLSVQVSSFVILLLYSVSRTFWLAAGLAVSEIDPRDPPKLRWEAAACGPLDRFR
jgi:hypothetical protein